MSQNCGLFFETVLPLFPPLYRRVCYRKSQPLAELLDDHWGQLLAKLP